MRHQVPAVGAIVSIRQRRWQITHIEALSGTPRIDAVPLGASPSRDPVSFFAPFEDVTGDPPRLRARRVRPQRWRAIHAGLRGQAEHLDLPLVALDAHITLLPHQLEPLLAVRHGIRRILIADAVGLGKTIQAGLIAAELMRRGEASRILVLTPGHLVAQWQGELTTRVGLRARIASASSLAELASDVPRDTSPWTLAGTWIASLDFIKQPHVLATLPTRPWDLVVIDEAHMATAASDRRTAAHAIAERARRVVLLTATPFSGLDDGHSLRRLGALDGDDDLITFRRTRVGLGLPARRRTRTLAIQPSAEERHLFDLIAQFERAALRAATMTTAEATQLLISVLRKRALSTPHALALTAARRLSHLDGAMADAEPSQPTLDFGDDDGEALRATIGLTAERERPWMRRLLAAATAASRHCRKLRRVLALLQRAREPAIVFTEFRDSLSAMATALQRQHIAVALAHGGMSDAERQRALAVFASGQVRLLVATDVVSQGLNLHQRARWVVHLDLPWNPIRLEQRAGRVDRLGQTRDIHVTRVVLDLAQDLAFAERSDARRLAADGMAAGSDSRWRRRARAAAAVLTRRRLLAQQWRGPLPTGRPLSVRDAGWDVRTHDIGGQETVVQSGTPDATAAGALDARRRRVLAVVRGRRQRAASIERALARTFARSASTGVAGDRDVPLPGVMPIDVTRLTTANRSAQADAAREHAQRIASLESDAELPVVSTLRLTRE